jgi:isoquinoline 1-oxidoreductase beta subunit
MANALTALRPSRRSLIAAGLSAAGGLAIGVALPRAAQAGAGKTRRVTLASPEAAAPPNEINAWLVIDPDNTVLVRLAHSELGQGTTTALAMLVAEELGCDWSKIRCEYASSNRNLKQNGVYKSQTTVGSRGLRSSVQFMQQAGASARARLVEAAARRWDVSAFACGCADGKVTHAASGRSLDYGALCAEAAKVTLAQEPAIKTPDQFKLVGKWTPRLDTAPKLDGSAQFGIDAQVPGMVYAAVVSCPEWGGKLASADEAAVKDRRGVIAVVKLDDAVAVVADRYWRAKSALQDLKPQWAPGANATVDSAQLDKAYRDALDGPMVNARKDGDAAAALAAPGAKLVEAVYEVPYLAHAPMEPLNATVDLKPDRLDIWISTQSPMDVLRLGAAESGVAPQNVYVHNAFVGGGFGRRTRHDELVHAIAVAKVVKRPVKLIWSREQDIRRDRYRPQAAVRFKAALDGQGRPTGFQSRIAVGSLLRSLGGPNAVPSGIEPMAVEVIATHAYRFGANDIAVQLKNAHVPVMFWRSVGASQNSFFMESFVDEMAHAAGQDPYAFRKALLDRADYLAVLDTMAKRGNWGEPLPPERGRGMAIIETYGTVTGQVAEVTVSPAGKVKVDRVVCVVDCYHAANPNTIAQQIEGGVVFGLTAALYGEIAIKNGGPVQGNFDTYRMLTMAETPKIEVYLQPSGGKAWGGIGEPSVAPIAPAVCNAIFAATGKRVRKLPLKNIDLRSV